ncbi:DUF4136 domain-containing protein [Tenacibaculum sp. 190524A02b]|uniref:DUF4136 domain-containing protein n=1 Tax=Tenacibaculum vairaonense TaxID=3137860 RepID=UPI0031FB3937
MKKIALFLILIITAGCSSSRVTYDYDNKTNFSKQQTFGFFDDVGEGLNEFDIKRIRTVIADELRLKGMGLSENPDFYINFFSKQTEDVNRSTIGVGIGGGGNVGFGISGGIPIDNRRIIQTLTIDFVKANTDDLFWQGISEHRINEQTTPYKRLNYYRSVINKIFSNYPPNKH